MSSIHKRFICTGKESLKNTRPTRYWPDPKWFKYFRFLSNKIEKKKKQSKQYLSICKDRTIESSQIIFNKGLSPKSWKKLSSC